MKPSRDELKEMHCGELYGLLNKRMTTALMLHSEMSDYFNFLGLHGFKRIHEYQYFKESIGKRKLNSKFLDMYNKLIPEKGHEKVEVMPDEWYKHTRMDIDDSVMSKYTKAALKTYREWEEETKQMLEDICSVLMEKGMMADYEIMRCYLKDVCCELQRIYRMCEELNNVGYDVLYITEIQKRIHDEYKCKMKKLKIQK